MTTVCASGIIKCFINSLLDSKNTKFAFYIVANIIPPII